MASIHTGGYRDRVFADETQQTGGYRDRAFASDADKETRQASPALSFTYNGQHYSYSDSDLDTMRRSYASMRKSDAKYAQSSAAAYTNTEFDRKMQSYGLPAWSEWGTVQKYAQGGGLQENYGNLTKDNWAKINELWAKDWEYSLTSEDAARKSMGLAPASYDSMYENTWLDNELKEKGLPPSKLLNGKLGETYNAWVSDTETYNNFMTDVTREWAKMKQNGSGLSFDDALNSILARSEYGDFISKHYGAYKEEPNPTDEKYLIKDEFGFAMQNDAGEDMYDSAKYREDLVKASAANAKLDADEFAITFEKAQEYYDRNYAAIKAYDDAIAAYKAKGVNPLTATEAQMEEVNDLYSGMQADAYTVDQLFPDANLSAVDKFRLQPYVDKLNNIMKTQGISAAERYIRDDLKNDLRVIYDEDIVAAFRQQYPETKKNDSEILDDYYNGIATSYGMNAEQAAFFRKGTLTLDSYMSGIVYNDTDAWNFAEMRKVRELREKGMPDTKAGIESKIQKLKSESRSFVDPFSKTGETISYGITGTDHSKEISELQYELDRYDDDLQSYYYDALQYTPDFKKSELDESSVDAKFAAIATDAFSKQYRNGDNVIDNKRVTLVRENATDAEKAVVVYLSEHPRVAGFGGQFEKEGADEYVKQLGVKYSNEDKIAEQQWYADQYNKMSGFGKFVDAAVTLQYNILMNPVESAYNFVRQTISMFSGRDLYANDMWSPSSDAFSAIAGEISKDSEFMSGAYQFIPSFVQSAGGAAAAAATGGATEVFTLAAMGMQSYSSTAKEALLNGATSEQAWTLGLAAGTAEIMFEKVSLDKYLEGLDGFEKAVKAAGDAGRSISKQEALDLT